MSFSLEQLVFKKQCRLWKKSLDNLSGAVFFFFSKSLSVSFIFMLIFKFKVGVRDLNNSPEEGGCLKMKYQLFF